MTQTEKVSATFAGISAGDPTRATQYIDRKRFVQHNPYAGDGVEGLTRFVSVTPREQLHMAVIRAFEDGPFVVTQAKGLRSGRNIFFDIFKFEGGLVFEHWAFATTDAPPNEGGHTQTDGPTQPISLEDTEKNKAFVRDYYETVHVSGDHSKIPHYVAEGCIRHEPGVSDGMAAFQSDLQRLIKGRSIDEIKFVLGQGDFVFIAAKGTHHSKPCLYIDLYRVEDGKIAERWGFPDEVPPQEEWKNNNGML